MLARLVVGSLDDCWEWPGARGGYGHGVIGEGGRGGRTVRVHRVMFQLAHGWLPPAVCHACDNPPCCNPLHLFAGTQAINQRDMRVKGRGSEPPHRRGAANPKATLTDGEGLALRARIDSGELTQTQAAAVYGLPLSTVHRIYRRQGRWSHVV